MSGSKLGNSETFLVYGPFKQDALAFSATAPMSGLSSEKVGSEKLGATNVVYQPGLIPFKGQPRAGGLICVVQSCLNHRGQWKMGHDIIGAFLRSMLAKHPKHILKACKPYLRKNKRKLHNHTSETLCNIPDKHPTRNCASITPASQWLILEPMMKFSYPLLQQHCSLCWGFFKKLNQFGSWCSTRSFVSTTRSPS